MATTRQTFVPDRKQRLDAILHIVYEYANLISAAHWSMRGQAPWRTHADDAFLLGCRKIGDFLMSDKRRFSNKKEFDDILALDYLPDDAIRTWDVPIWAGEWRTQMNKRLAHIAYTQGKPWVHYEWVPRLEREFREAWMRFRQMITDVEYAHEFERQIIDCRAKQGFAGIVL